MAARHAGFAAVGCLSEDLVNSVVEAAFRNAGGPMRFSLPSPLVAGGATVVLSGQFTILPPIVTFRRRPDNLVAVRARFVSDLRLSGATRDPVMFGISDGVHTTHRA
jgi:hypothetical protein